MPRQPWHFFFSSSVALLPRSRSVADKSSEDGRRWAEETLLKPLKARYLVSVLWVGSILEKQCEGFTAWSSPQICCKWSMCLYHSRHFICIKAWKYEDIAANGGRNSSIHTDRYRIKPQWRQKQHLSNVISTTQSEEVQYFRGHIYYIQNSGSTTGYYGEITAHRWIVMNTRSTC